MPRFSDAQWVQSRCLPPASAAPELVAGAFPPPHLVAHLTPQLQGGKAGAGAAGWRCGDAGQVRETSCTPQAARGRAPPPPPRIPWIPRCRSRKKPSSPRQCGRWTAQRSSGKQPHSGTQEVRSGRLQAAAAPRPTIGLVSLGVVMVAVQTCSVRFCRRTAEQRRMSIFSFFW